VQGPIVPQITSLQKTSISCEVAEFLIGLDVLKLDKNGSLQLSDRVKAFNMAICPRCRSFMISTHRHDFVTCRCEKDEIFIDGGNDYCRMGGTGHILPR
jgi:hypothetical protein